MEQAQASPQVGGGNSGSIGGFYVPEIPSFLGNLIIGVFIIFLVDRIIGR
jgi:hypothetical protein